MKRANKNETRKKNAHRNASIHDGIKVAILVDGGFYRKRANYTHSAKTPKERADELDSYKKNVQFAPLANNAHVIRIKML